MSARLDWQARGACRTGDPDAWFADNMTTAAAQRLCAPCPVRAECLTWALDSDERYGVWGGTTAAERLRIRRSRSKPTAAEAEAATTSDDPGKAA